MTVSLPRAERIACSGCGVPGASPLCANCFPDYVAAGICAACGEFTAEGLVCGTCRALAELARRRLQRQLRRLEQDLALLEATDGPVRDRLGRGREQLIAASRSVVERLRRELRRQVGYLILERRARAVCRRRRELRAARSSRT